ncbi:uncharacterized protein LOC110850127 [Folsomia candida]|uniref:Protein quiver n=1 Tax=Folsomia candida TaxID=158441 RepID=A0A226E793_FOLCA|nr:uncharacterized protein LOC110850127 [Folsomia candida]XP_021953301.1 uncharacterized protein LOC110850127 [Folsomia candida]OXA53465.1 hypothetical protein Fcan01_10674 [Folsomia candida]
MTFSHLTTVVLAVTFAFVVIPSTEALKCYNCFFLQGSNSSISTPQCESNTKNLTSMNCGTRTAEEFLTVTASPSYSRNSVLAVKTLCGTGKGTSNGKKVVLRTCIPLAESTHDGKCNKYYDWTITFPNGTTFLRFPANGTNALETCLCSKDDCNGQNNANGLHSGVAVAVLGTFLVALRTLY